MYSVNRCTFIIAALLLSGCGEKAPEIPPPEPTAALLAPSASYSLPQSALAFISPANSERRF